QPIGGVSLRDPTAAATGELLYDLVLAANGPWTEQVALGIYVAILTDTGSFRFSNTTPDTHIMAADLINRGVDSEDVYSRIYGRARLRKYQLLGAALKTLENDEEYGIAWMTIPADAYEALGATAEDAEGMVDVPRSIVGNNVALLFSKATTGAIKISFRSSGRFNVNQLAQQFGGGGHMKASGAMVEGPLEGAIEKVLMAAREMIAREPNVVLEGDT
ncbi:MAG: DHHA1 domain-containing protein, partial [Gemmatimonadota bacterium]|nr:DHHA1 domain-containing protein [Gemmatimonadota bacterium]